MRIDKFLALQGLGTRTEVHTLLRGGRVRVDGRPVPSAGFALDPRLAHVTLDGEALTYREALHLMLNKPGGVVTAAEDARHRTVMELLPRYARAMGCMPVGRLDLDTEGLLLLTTDGQLSHRLTAPKRHVDKRYYAEVDAPLDPGDAAAFAAGLPLDSFTAMPARLEILPDGKSAFVTVQEGKFHQVKRMFLARGKGVTFLKRVAFGSLALDAALAPGGWRELTPEEYLALQQDAQGGPHA